MFNDDGGRRRSHVEVPEGEKLSWTRGELRMQLIGAETVLSIFAPFSILAPLARKLQLFRSS